MAWQGDQDDPNTGEVRRIFIVRDASAGFHWGVSERHALKGLRQVPNAARVWLEYKGERETGKLINGEKQTVMEFDVIADKTRPAPAASSSGAPF